MVGYLKLKTENKELYESNFLEHLKLKKSIFYKLQYYICYFFYELVVFIKYVFNIITVKQTYNSYIFIFPFNEANVRKSKVKKCMNKLKKLMEKYDINSLVISKEIKKVVNFENDLCLLNGSSLMPYLIKEIFTYILEKQNIKTELEDIYLCMKEVKQIHIENIYYLANYFRSINIVTPKVNAFQKIADKLGENAMITVMNNKKKSLAKAKYIVNFDFTKDEISKYTVYRRAIIISINKDGICSNVGFDGIQICDVKIDTSSKIKNFFKKNNLLELENLNILYESLINKHDGFSKIKQKMNEDKVNIIKLYGKNGEVEEEEYLKLLA